MSDPRQESEAGMPEKRDADRFALRGRPRPVVRFRRGLIIGITASVAGVLVALTWLALEPPSFRGAATAIGSERPRSNGADDALAALPKSYADVPRLGPPLPGDLGRPILEHQRSVADRESGQAGESPELDAERARAAAAETEQQRLLAERRAARTSAVIVQLHGTTGTRGAEPVPRTAAMAPNSARVEDSGAPAVDATGQQRKIAFARSGKDDVASATLQPAPSPWTLSAGTIIPASLITGLDSDLPGIVIAQVTDNVRDSATGRTVLIPQGARLIGSYDSVVAYGQRRALLVWSRIVLPDGSSIRLDNMPATDASGYSGLEDEVDSHSWRLIEGIALSTLLGAGTQLGLGSSDSDLVRAIRESTQQNAAHAGDRITGRNLDVQPTIKVRPGWPVRAIVNKDLVLRPWRG